MLVWENVCLAVLGIKNNKMRSLLTMLGIIIGISSVIAIVSIGGSISSGLEKSLKDMGIENVNVRISAKNEEDSYDGYSERPKKEDSFTMRQIEEFKEISRKDVKYVGLEKDAGAGELRVGKKSENIQVSGANTDKMFQDKIKIIQGRGITDRDLYRVRNVAVISSELANKMRKSGKEPLGNEIKMIMNEQIETFMVLGVYKNKKSEGGFFGGGYVPMDLIYIPYTTAQNIKNESGITDFIATPAYGKKGTDVTEAVDQYFGRLYEKNPKWKISSYNLQGDLEDMTNMLQKVKIAIAIIAGISLLVGGIGVMNIMLVSVTERTREIGVRKALGAKGFYIKLQFIVEAVIICAIGGLIGIAFGLGLSAIVAMLMNNPIEISLLPILVSVLFSMSIGVFFGYYPASKAAKLDPIEALRYE